MITSQDIHAATATHEMLDLIRDAASERNCEFNDEAGFDEQAAFYREEARCSASDEDDETAMKEFADLLDAADKRWEEIAE
ncbi:hypothetical protein [Modicisalibacter sp. MOD 31.J]|uniref:hypothetical protein n=1 Tax=Modicisalibacter sp. MOD 31.J TaxID=2831897 RepID=UPI001CCE99DB|nr:hypothetical protein [Modicisalibacter sp. MOD 31.J]MBZ9574481.1 hypothetical protein [Modicisalibacter sp. MOD 31.J]